MRTVETRRSEMRRTALAGLAAVALAGFFSSTPFAQAVNPAVLVGMLQHPKGQPLHRGSQLLAMELPDQIA